MNKTLQHILEGDLPTDAKRQRLAYYVRKYLRYAENEARDGQQERNAEDLVDIIEEAVGDAQVALEFAQALNAMTPAQTPSMFQRTPRKGDA